MSGSPRSCRTHAFALAFALALALGAPAAAQSVFLPPQHWALAALARLDALGLGGGALDPGAGSMTREEAGRRLDAAAALALARDQPALERLARSYALRLREELGGAGRGDGPRLLPGDATLDDRHTRGQLYAGYDRNGEVFPPTPAAPVAGLEGGATLAAAWGRLAFLASPRLLSDGALTAAALYAAASAGRVQAWAGRRAIGFGAEAERSAVLHGDVAFDGAGLVLDSVEPRPFLGPMRLELLGARLHRSGALTRPWFGAARVWFRPDPRLWLGVNRAFTLGGHGNTALHPADVGRFLLGLGSGAHGETENQVASLEGRWRVPLALPLVAYGEWALDDLGFSFIKVPGLLGGLELPALPALPEVALGLEAASFAGHCCRNPPWYRHSALPWIERRIPLGHPLGGQGTEWLGYGRADLLHARLRLAGQAFLRQRGPENLYSPPWQGHSHGGQLSAELSLGPALELYASGDGEAGRGWRASSGTAGVRVRYSP